MCDMNGLCVYKVVLIIWNMWLQLASLLTASRSLTYNFGITENNILFISTFIPLITFVSCRMSHANSDGDKLVMVISDLW